METIYKKIRNRARQIVSGFPSPDFYKDCSEATKLSRKIMEESRDISVLKSILSNHLENDFGHGLQHAIKVTQEAGALVLIEGRRSGYPEDMIKRHVFLVQCAGLLHDIKRKQKNHAAKGAEFAGKILQDFPLSSSEVDDVCAAIRNHEAFQTKLKSKTPRGKLVSDCLYDADKFRWGPDNFTDTLWEMVSFFNPPLSSFIEHYPKGMESLEKIKKTFRSYTGTRYGPQFIDIGIAIGEELYRVILEEFT